MSEISPAERPEPVLPYALALAGGAYLIHWRSAPAQSAVEVFAGPDPEQVDFSRPLAKDASGCLEVRPEPAVRHYFVLRGAGRDIRLATRSVPLAGVSNFRDLGGYMSTVRGADGQRRQIKWGRLFRSSDFNELSDDDRAVLGSVGLRQVIDFRSREESERRPNHFGSPLEIECVPIPIDPGSGAGFRSMWTESANGPGFMIEAMSTMNRILVREHGRDYRTMFDRLLEGGGAPAAIGCASGKDRTGVGSALILLSLGVDREVILYDYLLTNLYLRVEDRVKEGLENMARYTSRKIDPAAITPMYDARRAFLTAALDEIDLLHGSSERYLRNALGLDHTRLARMRELYLD